MIDEISFSCTHMKEKRFTYRNAQISENLEFLGATSLIWSSFHIDDQKMSDANVQIFVAKVTWRPWFVPIWNITVGNPEIWTT